MPNVWCKGRPQARSSPELVRCTITSSSGCIAGIIGNGAAMKHYQTLLCLVSILFLSGCPGTKRPAMDRYSEEIKAGDSALFAEKFDDAIKHYGAARENAERLSWTFGVVRADLGTVKGKVAMKDNDAAEQLLKKAQDRCRLDSECSKYKLYDVYGELIGLLLKSSKPDKREQIHASLTLLIEDSAKFNRDEASLSSLRWIATELDDAGFKSEATTLRLTIH